MEILPVPGLPEVQPGDDLCALITETARGRVDLRRGDLLVVAQKIVSKAEGRFVRLRDVQPGAAARALAAEVSKDPRLVELILAESNAVIRKRPGLLIVEHRSGHVLANAGIDSSNIFQRADDPVVLLWPVDPDASARRLARCLEEAIGCALPVIVNDSIGRAWRYGTVGHAIGCSGVMPLWNQVGEKDRFGNVLRVTEPATADAIAAAAALVQGEAAEGLPVVRVRDCPFLAVQNASARQLQRDAARDLFR